MIDIEIGTIKNIERKKNRDGNNFVRMLTCQVSDDQDNISVELINPAGEDSVPNINDPVLVISVGDANKYGFSMDSDLDVSLLVSNGERLFFSRDGINIKAQLFLNKLGEIILNQGAGFAVEFNALKSDLADTNTLIKNHIHGGVTVGGGSTGVVSNVPGDFFDIDSSKVEKVKL